MNQTGQRTRPPSIRLVKLPVRVAPVKIRPPAANPSTANDSNRSTRRSEGRRECGSRSERLGSSGESGSAKGPGGLGPGGPTRKNEGGRGWGGRGRSIIGRRRDAQRTVFGSAATSPSTAVTKSCWRPQRPPVHCHDQRRSMHSAPRRDPQQQASAPPHLHRLEQKQPSRPAVTPASPLHRGGQNGERLSAARATPPCAPAAPGQPSLSPRHGLNQP
jgi:hypothetical protein